MSGVLAGNRPDFHFGVFPVGWKGFHVVRFHGLEEISRPYRFDITLARPVDLDPIDLSEVLNQHATLAIRSTLGWRRVHGLVARAQRLEHTKEVVLYRVRLVPHVWRTTLRKHCRTFVNQTLTEIIESVLEGKSPAFLDDAFALFKTTEDPKPPPSDALELDTFVGAPGSYRWRITDQEAERRLDDKALRQYVVQYNETDFDFVSRLLEEEGISYTFENGEQEHVMVLTDRPGSGGELVTEEHTLRSIATAGVKAEPNAVRAFHEQVRLSTEEVQMRDTDWQRAPKVLEGKHALSGHTPAVAFEFPGRDEAVGRADHSVRTSDHENDDTRTRARESVHAQAPPCAHPARLRAERLDVERSLSFGRGTVRSLVPGRRFALRDQEMNVSYQELVTVRVETYAEQLVFPDTEASREPPPAGFETGSRGLSNRFTALRKRVPYRPAITTAKPRIDGVHSATVWGPDGAGGPLDIFTDNQGRVLLRFPWDQREDDGASEPSCWIRVSDQWAGGGYGALCTPRVGHEVLVAYHRGDPERPVIVGRVYNDINRPPYEPAAHPTKSTLQSRSSSVNSRESGFNELLFEDKHGAELFSIHAQRDMSEHVNNCHTTFVGANQSHTVKKDRTRIVEGEEHVRVKKDRSLVVEGEEGLTVKRDRSLSVFQNELISVTQNREVIVKEGSCYLDVRQGGRGATIKNNDQLRVDGTRTVTVKNGMKTSITAGDYQIDVSRHMELEPKRTFKVTTKETKLFQDELDLTCDSAFFRLSASMQAILDTGGGAKIALVGEDLVISAQNITLKAVNAVRLQGKTVQVAAEKVETAGAEISEAAAMIKMNC